MGDETWCYQFDLESKWQSIVWSSPTSSQPKKSCLQKFKIKTLLITFFNNKEIINEEFAPVGQTINAAIYQVVLNRLLQCIWWVWPEFHRTGKWMLLHDNTPTYNAICVLQFWLRIW